MQNPPSRSATRRAQIEHAAVQLFRTQGYEGTPLAAIAEQLGITAPALYRHYRSKQDLLVACLENTQQRLLDRTAAALTSTDPVERLQQFVRAHVGFQLDEFEAAQLFGGAVYGTLLLSESLPAERQARLRGMEQTQLDTLREILHAGIDAGAFEAVTVTPTAFAIIGMGEHTSLWFRPDGDLDSSQIADLYADLATKMVLAA